MTRRTLPSQVSTTVLCIKKCSVKNSPQLGKSVCHYVASQKFNRKPNPNHLQMHNHCYDFLFSFLLRSSADLLLHYTDFSPSFCGCLTPKPGFHYSAPRMAYFSSFLPHGHPFLFHVQRVVLPTSFYRTSHLPFISALAFLLWTLLGLCAGSPLI